MGESSTMFIAGPTASGKSAAALEVAEGCGGEIVNADSMQVYRDLRVLTARPSQDDEARVPHHLYGAMDASEICSAGRWARAAARVIAEIHERGNRAIIVGGTGLYFRALEEGLSPIPEIAPEFREKAQTRRELLGADAFRDEVLQRDPAMEKLPSGDAQRLIRAWEVYEATGERLSAFQERPRRPLIAGVSAKIVILPPREILYARCDERVEIMTTSGAVEEVRALIARNLDASLPAMKALGVAEITAYLEGRATHEEMLGELQQATRRYAKRQVTWFRNQARDWLACEDAASVIARLNA